MPDLDSCLTESFIGRDGFVKERASLVSGIHFLDGTLTTSKEIPNTNQQKIEIELSSVHEDLMEELMAQAERGGIQMEDSDRNVMSLESENFPCIENQTTSSGTVDWIEKRAIHCRHEDLSDNSGSLVFHLLTACAETISDGSHDLAEILFCRLRQLVSARGSNVERVAFYLSRALHQIHHLNSVGDPVELKQNPLHSNDLSALYLLNQMFPFMRMAHFTANQSIMEAIKGEGKTLHIIDFDIMEGMQWPPLMEALKSGGYKIGHLKITALTWDCGEDQINVASDSVPMSSYTGKMLSLFADSLGIAFSFEEADLENMKSKEDEIVAVNCMWELPHLCERSRSSLVDFIHAARQLNPVILTIGTGPPDEPHEKLDFLESFGECFGNLCAVFDCSEAALPDHYALARATVENLFLAPTVCRPLNYFRLKDGLLGPLVLDIPPKCGFVPGELSKKNTMHANQMLLISGFPILYRVKFVGTRQLFLQCHSTVLSRISVWKPID